MQKNIRSFDGVRIHYDVSIRKTPHKPFLVFLHGAGGDLTAWKKERAFFHGRGFSTIAIDLRGHGLSERPNHVADYALEYFAKDVAAVVQKEGISKFILVGHCFGGMVAIVFHKLFPVPAKGYVLIDTTYKAPQPLKAIFKHHPFFTSVVNFILTHEDIHAAHFSHVNFEKFVGTGDWNVMRIYSDITHTTFKSWLFTFENVANFNGIRTLKNMRRPVLIIEGKKDSVFNILVAQKIKNLTRMSTLDIIPQANHIIVINNPAIVEKEILRFVQALA